MQCPPSNTDTKERLQLGETNISDDLNSTLHKCKTAHILTNIILVTQTETMKLFFAIVDCYRITLQSRLKEKIENLTESLAQTQKSFSERKNVYSELQMAEEELKKSHLIVSSAIPHEITSYITSLSNVISESAPWSNKLKELAKQKVKEPDASGLSLSEWISILSRAHSVLTDNDWDHIALHVVCNYSI